MKSSTGPLLRSPKALIISLASICALVLVVGASRISGSGPKQQDATAQIQSITPRVQNKTRSFELTQAPRNRGLEGAGPELSLRNGYDKNITACAVSVNGLRSTTDFAYSEDQHRRAIAPGAVYTRGFSYVVRSINRETVAEPGFDINVLAVVFDDKSSDGDESAVASILYDRRKSKRLLKRIVELFSRDLSSLRTIDDTAFDELRSRISPLSSDPGDSSDINRVLRWLDQSDQGLSPRQRIIQVKEICANLVDRL